MINRIMFSRLFSDVDFKIVTKIDIFDAVSEYFQVLNKIVLKWVFSKTLNYSK